LPEKLNSSKLILIPKVSILKINMQVWLPYMKNKTTITLQMKGKSMAQRTDICRNQKAHLTGEFVILGKFGDHALRHLASRLANVGRQGGRLKT